jgi:hypothetical protein
VRYDPDLYGPPEYEPEDPGDGDEDLWAEAAREQAYWEAEDAREQAQWEADAAAWEVGGTAWQAGHDD